MKKKILLILLCIYSLLSMAQLPSPHITCKRVQVAYPEKWAATEVDFTANAFWYQYNFTFNYQHEQVKVYAINNKNFFSVDFLSQLFIKDIQKQYNITDRDFVRTDSSLYHQSYNIHGKNKTCVSVFQEQDFVIFVIKEKLSRKSRAFWNKEHRIINILPRDTLKNEYLADNIQEDVYNKKQTLINSIGVMDFDNNTQSIVNASIPATLLENKMGVGKTGLFQHISFAYPIDWQVMSSLQSNNKELILSSPAKQYIIVQQETDVVNKGSMVYNSLKEERIINTLPGVVFDSQIHSIRVVNGTLFQYKHFYLAEKSLYGLLAFVNINQQLYSITIQSFSEISLDNIDYNMFFQSLVPNTNKDIAGSLAAGNIRLKLPEKYHITDYKKGYEIYDFQSFEASAHGYGTASINFYVINADLDLITLATEHQKEQSAIFTDSDKIALNKLNEYSLVYYTSSNDKALYCVTCCFHYKGQTFLIDIHTNALKDTFFEGNDFIELLESIDVVE